MVHEQTHVFRLMSQFLIRFDIYSFGFNTEEDENGMLESARSIDQLISNEIGSGIDASRIVLGGFSQGGTMSFLTGLTGERKLAGIASLSGWLPLPGKFKSVRIPILSPCNFSANSQKNL